MKQINPCQCGETNIQRLQLWFSDSTEEDMVHEDGTKKWTYLKCPKCGTCTLAYCYEITSTQMWNKQKNLVKGGN